MRQPNEVLALELFSFLLLLLLYALKRFITRNRYVERLKGWGGKKRAEVGEKWNDFMDRVGRVNSTLAFILPHILFFLLSSGLLYLLPSFSKWIADDLRGVAVLSIVYPTLGSVRVMQAKLVLEKVGGNGGGGEEVSTPPKSNKKGGGNGKKKKRPSPKKTPTPRQRVDSILKSPLTSPIMRVGGGKRTKSDAVKPEEALFDEISDDLTAALRYWVVFGVVSAVYSFLSLLPLVTRMLPTTGSYSGPLRLLFFAYLHSPLDGTALLYEHVCPLALRLADKTAGARNGNKDDTLGSLINKLTSLLSLAKMVGLCSEGTRDKANAALRESFGVLPALVCLGMPSYFVEFGVLWTSMLVPAANAARANANVDLEVPGRAEGQGRWLKYFITYSACSCLLGITEGWWRWAPFSTHVKLIFWVVISVPGLGVSDRVFAIVLNELVGWGLVSGDGWKGVYEVGEDTVLVRGLRAISSHNIKLKREEGKGGEEKKGEEDGDGVGILKVKTS